MIFLFCIITSSGLFKAQITEMEHLVIRGSYRILSLVVYGNTTEELGQFSVEFDLDNSLASLVRSPAEGKIEDLPLALQPIKSTFEESISSLRQLHRIVEPLQLPLVKQILYLSVKIGQMPLDEGSAQKLIKALLSATSPFLSIDFSTAVITGNHKRNKIMPSDVNSPQIILSNLVETKNELMDMYKKLGSKIDDLQSGKSEHQFEMEKMAQVVTEDLVVNIFQLWFQVDKQSNINGISKLSQVISLFI